MASTNSGCGCDSAITLPSGQPGPPGADAMIIVPNTVYVSTSGHNSGTSIGLTERLDRPFLTIGAAITAAITLTPSVTKRITIVLMPGTYVENPTIANANINLVGLESQALLFDGNGYTIIDTKSKNGLRPYYINGTLTINASNIEVKGINCNTLSITNISTNSRFDNILASTSIITNQTTLSGNFYDVHSNSFLLTDSNQQLSGYFEKCTGGDYAFGGNDTGGGVSGILSCKMTDCIGNNYSFSSSANSRTGNITGIFIRCKTIGDYSFGSTSAGIADGSLLSGIFNNCECTGDASFGYGGFSGSRAATLSGTFIECRGTSNSFGSGGDGSGIGGGILSGNFYNCVATSQSFGSGDGGAGGTLSGNFYNCVATSQSFGFGDGLSTQSVLSGNFYNCTATTESFGSSSILIGGILSGNFYNCTGGNTCFGSSTIGNGGIISGYLKDCTALLKSFCWSNATGGTVTDTAILINCISKTGNMLRKAIISGKIIGSKIDSVISNEPGIIISGSSTAVISHCKIRGNGTASSITAGSAKTASITFTSTFGKGLNSNVTNSVTTGYNIDDINEIF